MHHERIAPWADYDNTALRPEHARADILQLLRWMSPRAAATVRHHGPPEPAFGRYLRWFAAKP